MPQPWKHPKSGVYYYRKVVPAPLRVALGRTEFRTSLGTKDIREAKLRYPEVAARVNAEFAKAEGGPVTLTHRQITALAGVWYRRELQKRDESPGDAVGWEQWHFELQEAGKEDRLREAVRTRVDELLKAEGFSVDARTRDSLDGAIFWNGLTLCEAMQRRAEGDYRPDTHLATLPDWTPPAATSAPDRAMNGTTFQTLIHPSTVY